MAGMPVKRWLAYRVETTGGQSEEGSQSGGAQVRLVAQYDGPVGKPLVPTTPKRRALNRAEHAALGRLIDDTLMAGDAQPLQFPFERPVRGPDDDRDLPRFEALPLFEQVAEHRSLSPR